MWKGKKRQRTEIWWFYNLIRTLMDIFTAWSLNRLRIKLNFLYCRLFTFWYNSCLLSYLVTCYHILGDRCASTSISPIKSGAFSFTRKQKKIPAALKEVNRLNLCQMCDVILHLWHCKDSFFACLPGVCQHWEFLHEWLPKQVKRQQEAVEEAVVCH